MKCDKYIFFIILFVLYYIKDVYKITSLTLKELCLKTQTGFKLIES